MREIKILGTEYVSPSIVRSKIDLQNGKSYLPAMLRTKVRSSIKNLYDSELFSDIKVDIDYVGTMGEVDLSFLVKENNALDTVIIEGIDELLLEDIEPLVRLRGGRVFSQSMVEKDRQRILEYYKSEGFLLVEIAIKKQVVSETGRVILTFAINEGEKVMVDNIVIEGAEVVPEDDIISAMGSEIDHWYSDGEFSEESFEDDVDSILRVTKTFGFLDAEVSKKWVEYIPDSSFKFYLGRATAKNTTIAQLLNALNKDIAQSSTALSQVVGAANQKSSHYYRQFRNHENSQAVLNPKLKTEEEALEALNRVLSLSELREQYIELNSERKDWNNAELDSLYTLKKFKRVDEKRLVRLILEHDYPVVKYSDIVTSSKVRLHYILEEGQRYYAGNFAFTGNEVLSTKFLESRVSLDSGDVFDFSEYQMMNMLLTNSYREDGYLFVRMDEKKTYIQDSIINITYDVTEGLPAQIRKVIVSNNTKTKDRVIRREVKLYPGDTYRQSLMERSFRDIMQLNFFDNVIPDIRPVNEQDVDLVFDVTEKEAGTGTFSAGVAFSQSDGFVLTSSVAIPNCCMGDGRLANLNLEYGPSKKSATLGFTEPWFLDTPTKLGGSLNYTWYEGSYDDSDIIQYGGSVFVGRRLKWPDDYFYAQASYYWQNNLQGDNVDESMILYSGIESSVGVSLSRDDKNLPQFPTDGSRYVLSARYSGIGGDFQYVKSSLSVKWWFPIWKDLALRLESETGAISGVGKNTIQYNSLYRMGGMLGYQGKLRGYSAGSVGYRRLGRSYQSFVAELTYPIAVNRFYALAFFDAGNVFGSQYDPSQYVSKDVDSPFQEWDPTDLLRDYGFGVRVVVPMLGIIGFDFAWPLDPGENYYGTRESTVGGMEFNFIIGQSF